MKSDQLKRAQRIQEIIIMHVTGTSEEGHDDENISLREMFLQDPYIKDICPELLIKQRNLKMCWNYLQPLYKTYKERRMFVYEQFTPLVTKLEMEALSPSELSIIETLKTISWENVQRHWTKLDLRKRLLTLKKRKEIRKVTI